MSEFELPPDLIEEIVGLLADHDPEAQDPLVAMQYLAAINAFILAHQDMPPAERVEYLDDLHTFAGHVLADLEQQAAPAADATGIWRPDMG